MFDSRPMREHFGDFLARVESAIGRTFLPIYRMADGEFIFSVGPKAPLRLLPRIRFSVRRAIEQAVTTLTGGSAPDGVSTAWGERYDGVADLQGIYVGYLRQIADSGMLAIHFTRTAGRFSEEYFAPMCNWLEAQSIALHMNNYVPFYFVYALLNGPSQRVVYEGRNILIVTSLNGSKRSRIAERLLAMRAKSVQFLEVSPTRALLDSVSLAGLYAPIDVALVAAGIGSANILVKLRGLGTLCIDGGICIECLADSTRENERIFLRADHAIG